MLASEHPFDDFVNFGNGPGRVTFWGTPGARFKLFAWSLVALLVNAPVAFPILIPIGISIPGLANLIIFSGDSVNRQAIVRAELVIILLESVFARSEDG